MLSSFLFNLESWTMDEICVDVSIEKHLVSFQISSLKSVKLLRETIVARPWATSTSMHIDEECCAFSLAQSFLLTYFWSWWQERERKKETQPYFVHRLRVALLSRWRFVSQWRWCCCSLRLHFVFDEHYCAIFCRCVLLADTACHFYSTQLNSLDNVHLYVIIYFTVVHCVLGEYTATFFIAMLLSISILISEHTHNSHLAWS